VTLTSILPRLGLLDRPARKPRHPQHRAVDEIDRQRTLRAGADLLIKGLRLQLEEQEAQHAEVVARIDERHAATVRELEDRLADLQRRLDVRTWAEAAAAKTQEIPVITRVLPLNDAADAGLLGPVTARGHVNAEGAIS